MSGSQVPERSKLTYVPPFETVGRAVRVPSSIGFDCAMRFAVSQTWNGYEAALDGRVSDYTDYENVEVHGDTGKTLQSLWTE